MAGHSEIIEELVFFYYAGHVVQFGNENYLLPIDTKLTRIEEVPYKTVPLGKLVRQMKFAGNQINIIILDACSPNPFIEELHGGTPGMMEIKIPKNMIISYACSPRTLTKKTILRGYSLRLFCSI